MSKVTHATELQILIVDDHAIVREGLKRILESSGKHMMVSEASSGAQALEMLSRQRIDLMIIDLSMPGMSGLDLIKRVSGVMFFSKLGWTKCRER